MCHQKPGMNVARGGFSTDLGGDDHASWCGEGASRNDEQVKSDCKDGSAYHDILDKGDARNGALYAKKDMVSMVPRNDGRRWRVQLRRMKGWSAVGGASRTWGSSSSSSKRPGMRSKTGQIRARGLQCLGRLLARTTWSTVACMAKGWRGLVAVAQDSGWVVQKTRGAQWRARLTNVEQHNLRGSPAREMERRGRHVVVVC
jgi:hypothetical protein